MSDDTVWWASDWRCPKCGTLVPIEPGQDTRPVEAEHVCSELDWRRAQPTGNRSAPEAPSKYALDLTDATYEHECVFVEEQEPTGRLVLPPCLVCGLTAMDALEQLRGER